MLCIASFFVFIVLGIFSAYYRGLAKKAWYCVGKRLTFKPCDIKFSEEIKGKLTAKLMFRHPKIAKFIGKWVDVLAFVFVLATIWSIFSVFITGLNLIVYDTCNPVAPESCSLGGESCGIAVSQLSFEEAVKTGKIAQWISAPFVTFADTVSRVPDRFQSWNASDYTSSGSSFYYTFDPQKPLAVEAIDPGCLYCQKLFKNIRDAGFEKRYNLTYIVYPIASAESENGTKFKYSTLVSSYLEAVKLVKLENTSDVAPDWQLLEYIFLGKNGVDTDLQYKINYTFSREEVIATLHRILKEIGYTEENIQRIAVIADSKEIKDTLAQNREMVEKKIRTLKIPTIIFDGRRYDRVVEKEKLQ